MEDPLLLSRIQFAANITFHILFPTITIGLAWVLLFFKLRYNRTRAEQWMGLYRFWVKIFALSFAMGVVTGITMSFQFGTNWPGYMTTVGNVAGPLLGYEVLSAFFLEASFFGIMLFGARRVGEPMHTIATFLVAFGTTLSALWILALNSWMQTPDGFEMIRGQAHVTDWVKVVFNPSFPYRFTHMLIASGLTVSFLLAGLSAYRLRRGFDSAEARAGLRTGVILAAVLIPLQIFVGDLHGLNTLKYQPAKIAAMEGHWTTSDHVPLVLFGWPDALQKSNRYAVELPGVASLILTHDRKGKILGIEEFPDHPPVAPVFIAFRIMVGLGLLMMLVSWSASWQLWRHGTVGPRLQRVLVAMSFSGWAAVIAGWYVTEVGRQPFLVSGVLRTKDAVTTVPGSMIGLTLATYLILYAVLIVAYMKVIFYLTRQADRGEKDLPPDAFSSKAVERSTRTKP